MNNLGSTQGYIGQSEQHDLDILGTRFPVAQALDPPSCTPVC